MRDQKPYCKEGESESHIALGIAIVWCIFTLMTLLMFLWVIGIIRP